MQLSGTWSCKGRCQCWKSTLSWLQASSTWPSRNWRLSSSASSTSTVCSASFLVRRIAPEIASTIQYSLHAWHLIVPGDGTMTEVEFKKFMKVFPLAQCARERACSVSQCQQFTQESAVCTLRVWQLQHVPKGDWKGADEEWYTYLFFCRLSSSYQSLANLPATRRLR